MEFEGIMKDIVFKAKQNKKRIVLPESTDVRVLKAASICTENNIADIVLIGNQNEIHAACVANDINLDFKRIKIEDPEKSKSAEKYINLFYELRKAKGITLEMAENILKDSVYFATMMVKANDADGMVCGASHSTADTLRPALQIIKTKPGVRNVSTFMIVETPKKELGKDGCFIFSDCGLIEFPTEEQLVDIALSSKESFEKFIGDDPKVAILSYSTKGSAKGEIIDKIKRVVDSVKDIDDKIVIDGELQLDAAIIDEVAKLKAPGSNVAGKANVLIFPDLLAGNIGCKLVQRFGDALLLGPVTQGLAKPVNDLSRGCSAMDIVGVVALTSLQVENK